MYPFVSSTDTYINTYMCGYIVVSVSVKAYVYRYIYRSVIHFINGYIYLHVYVRIYCCICSNSNLIELTYTSRYMYPLTADLQCYLLIRIPLELCIRGLLNGYIIRSVNGTDHVLYPWMDGYLWG